MTDECRKAQERALIRGPFGDHSQSISDHDKCPYRVQLSEHSVLICSCGCHSVLARGPTQAIAIAPAKNQIATI